MSLVIPDLAPTLIETVENEKFLHYVYDRAINYNARLEGLVQTKPFFDELVSKYLKPVAISGDRIIKRSYHDFNHIAEGVRDITGIESGCQCQSINSVLLAWFYHDAYYLIGTKTDNERNSADYALMDLIQMGWSGEAAGRVFDLIMWTKHNENPPADDYEANLIVDIDLLRMAATPVEAYFIATKMVRDEFALFPDKEWADGRIKFWKGFLERKNGRIFRTSHFEHLNKIAIDNINKEMFSLARGNFV